MTRIELKEALEKGAFMERIFDFREGQDCIIFKVEKMKFDDEICYIPDVNLNRIPMETAVDRNEIPYVVSCCYSGRDFLEEAVYDEEKAMELFRYCDWQHPSSAAPEVFDYDE